MTDMPPATLVAHGQRERAEPEMGALGAVNPTITTSWRLPVLIFSQSFAARPG
jgi:hypothetical protein